VLEDSNLECDSLLPLLQRQYVLLRKRQQAAALQGIYYFRNKQCNSVIQELVADIKKKFLSLLLLLQYIREATIRTAQIIFAAAHRPGENKQSVKHLLICGQLIYICDYPRKSAV
jgi:hypothetical protein